MAKNDRRPDNCLHLPQPCSAAAFELWPNQQPSPNESTWLDFSSQAVNPASPSIVNSSQALDVKVEVGASYDLRFQCYDQHGQQVDYACGDGSFNSIWVTKNGVLVQLIQVQNGDYGLNCQTVD